MAATVTGLTLINADTDRDVAPLANESTINLADVGSRLNVRANATADTGSVRFGLDRKSSFRTENGAPYALAGDTGGDYKAWTPTLGRHTLTATPFSADNAGGTAGAPVTVTFTVVNEEPQSPAPTPSPTAPAAPTSLTASAPSTSALELSWLDHAADEAGFFVERGTDATNFTRIATLGANSSGYTDSGLAAATTYYYRVAAYNDVGVSAYSNTGSATTKTAAGSPLIAQSFSSDTGDFAAVDGAWAVADGALRTTTAVTGATTHLNNRAVHKTAIAGDFTIEVDAAVLGTSSAWNDFAVLFGYRDAQNYSFVSFNESNDAATSGIFSVVNGVSTQLADIPGAIASDTTYRIRVERVGPEIRALRNGVLTASATESNPTSGQVGLGTNKDRGVFDNLVVTGTAAPAPTVPAAPSSLSAVASSSSRVDLSWSDNSGDEAGFKVERSADGGATWAQAAAVGANVRAYAATGLSAATAYQFRVRAYNAAGHSAYSNAAAATTQAAPPAPVAGDRPGPDNTGPTRPDLLVVRGSLTVSTDGAVIENVDVRGTITINANNVTIRNFRVDGQNNMWAVKIGSGYTGAVLEDGEITNASGAAVYMKNYTARRLDIHHLGSDGLKAGDDTVIEGCWIHHLGTAEGAHADGIQVSSGERVVIRGNYIDMPKSLSGYKSNATIFLKPDFGPIDDVLVEGNWLEGGNYTVYDTTADSVPCTNVTVRDNLFGRDYQYGAARFTGDTNVWDNNRWWDTLEFIPES